MNEAETQQTRATGDVPAMQVAITVVNRGMSGDVISASRRGGAEGGTIVLGRGTGIHERRKILGVPIEPEKDVVFTLASQDIMPQVVDEIVSACDLDKPATGICFVLPVLDVRGIHHSFTS